MNKTPKQLSLFLLSLASITGCSHTPIDSSTISATDKKMACIGPNIYVDPAMSSPQRLKFLRTVQQSKIEINNFFGATKSSPKIYACSTKKCFRQFGGRPAKAKAIDDDKVLLSKTGLDKTTLTHELAHIEFHKRLGAPHVWNKVPMWFDEGLAALACKDKSYTKTSSTLSLDKLVSQDQWINAIRDNKPAYSIAKQAVESWYKSVGTAGLQSVISRLQKGQKFSLNKTSIASIQ